MDAIISLKLRLFQNFNSNYHENIYLTGFSLSSIIFSCICIIPASIHSGGIPNIQNAQLAISGMHSLEYQNSLVAGFVAAMPMLFDFLTDRLSLKSRGAIFNLLIVLALFLPNAFILFYVIPYSDFRAVQVTYSIQLISVLGMVVAYLSYFGKVIWCKPQVMAAVFLVQLSLTMRDFELLDLDIITYYAISISSLTLEFLGYAIILFTSIQWLQHIRSDGLSRLSIDYYCCNIYISCMNLIAIALLILFCIFSLNDWNDSGGKLLAAQNYLFTIFLVIMTVYHARATRRELAISNSEHALELKKVLVRFLGHEIRTPLNTLFMGLQYFEEKLGDATWSVEELQGIVSDLKVSCDESISILNQLLLYDKIDSGIAKLDKSKFAIIPFLEEAMKPFHLQTRDEAVDMKLFIEPQARNRIQSCCLHADKNKVALVLRNLLSNAVKFTKKSSVRKVTMTAEIKQCPLQSTSDSEAHQEVLLISVTDTGAGISQENIARLFHEVVQFSPEKLQAGGGSGLGLWISQQIVSMHDGRLSASSAGEGQGSTFTLQLGVISDTDTVDSGSNSTAIHPERQEPFISPSALHSRENGTVNDHVGVQIDPLPCSRLLLVDDAKSNRKFACKLLSRRVTSLEEAEDGLEAVEKVKRSMQSGHPFDLILMDFVMPNMDGPSATRAIRELGYDGLVFGVTGNALADDVTHFTAHGASAVLPKPLSIRTLEVVLEGFNRRLAREVELLDV